jgi:hypothetical protein
MLLFTRLGRLSLLQHPIDTTLLQIHLQKQDQVDRLVAMLDEIGREQHAVQPIWEGDYRFQITARKATVAEAIARLVAEIDYAEFIRSVHFDFGAEPGFMLLVTANGLEVARLKTK